MNLTAKRLYFVLIGAVSLAFVALLFGAYGANTLLKNKSGTVREARLQNLVMEEKQRQLTRARADIVKYQALADIAEHIVPRDKDQAQTVREIVNIASQHGIKLGAITFPSSSLGDAKTQHSQLTPVKNIPGVLTLEITVQSDQNIPTTYKDLVAFLDALEHNRRTALVKNIALQPDAKSPNRLSFTLTLSEYIQP